MKHLTGFLITSLFFGASLAVIADPLTYQNAGTIAATHTFTAASTGEIKAYFYGASASDDESLGLSVNGVSTGIWGLQNHSSTYGQAQSFGSVTAGSILTFEILVQNTGYHISSDPTLNADGINHAYAHSFAGNNAIPSGTFIGFEDLLLTDPSDLDYNDETFVITNVSLDAPNAALMVSDVAETPEPASATGMALGFVGAAFCYLRSRRSAR